MRASSGAGSRVARVTLEPVAPPVAIGDVGRILVPVPGAGIAPEIIGRVARIQRVADPLDWQRLVHERAVRAVQREAGAPIAPVVRLARDPERARALVASH